MVDIHPIIHRLKKRNIPFFREPVVNEYTSPEETFVQLEFLVQDPDGYLLRFSQEMKKETSDSVED